MVSAANCADLNYICAHVTKGASAAYSENDDKANYYCQYIKDSVECTDSKYII